MNKIGVLGGGQLGMMLQEAVNGLDISLSFIDPDPDCSCKAVSEDVSLGSFKDTQTVKDFGADKSIVTVEIEHVDIPALEALRSQGVAIYPQPSVLTLIQDKGEQKQFYERFGFPTAPFQLLDSSDTIDIDRWPLPFVLKSRRGGYDGHGVKMINRAIEVGSAFYQPCLVEAIADIDKEISVIVARSVKGEVKAFPAVEMEFDPEANLVSALISPADISEVIAQQAELMATQLVEKLGMVGLLAVEFFLLKDGRLWVNEVAPRPHNSGHQTIEGNETSQYEQHLRAITGLPLGATDARGYAVMVNLLGSAGHEGPTKIIGAELIADYPGAYFHDYHKVVTRPKRKMGHITVVHELRDEALRIALLLQQEVKYVSKES